MKHGISRIGGLVFAIHATLMAVVQIENAVLSPHLALPDILPWQWTTLATSLLFAFAYEGARRVPHLRWLFYPAFFVVLAALVGNQFFYQIFQDSLTLSHLDEFSVGDTDNLVVSVRSEAGWFQFVNAVLLLAAAVALWVAERRWKDRVLVPLSAPRAMAATLALGLALVAGLVSFQPDPQSQVGKATSHIALSLWRGMARPGSAAVADGEVIPAPELWRLRYGTPLDTLSENDAMAAARTILQSRKRNVVIAVLESVGSRQLLQNGAPRADLAPFLSEAASHAVIFDNLTNQYPGSTRAHVGMTTGGFIPTWSSVTASLIHPYDGQSTVSEYRSAGYATALFSAAYLKYENLKSFYDRLGFDVVLTADSPENGLVKYANPGGWGVDEYAVLQRAMDWAKSADKPFLLNFQTISTHHPYAVPPAYAAEFGGADNLAKYESSIRFTDKILGDLAQDLKRMGKAEDTLLVVIGDHGEAFGDHHPGNFTHKNFLFEENVGNFLMIIDLGKTIEPVRSHRRGTIADVMPTLIAMQGMTPKQGLPGQDLMSRDYRERLAFFFKSAYPEQWGVRDGQWKFIANRLEPSRFELYDLVADPAEKTDIASKHADRAALYEKLAANWYVYLDKNFRDNLSLSEDDNVPKVALADVSKAGPVEIAVGSMLEPLPFRKLKEINPDETLTVWTYGGVFEKDTPVDYVFTSPSGEERRQTLLTKADWVNIYYFEKLPKRREEGLWKLRLETGRRTLIATDFRVSAEAPLLWSAFDQKPGARFIRTALAFDGEFQVVNKINPSQDVSLLVGLVPLREDKIHSAAVIAPDGTERYFSFNVQHGWKTSWAPVPKDMFATDGPYVIELFCEGQLLATTQVDVDSGTTLIRSVDTN